MKRINNKYRNNNGNNQIYSLNYKFDSSSIAGKISGTALDLIKRYNELAKDSASNNDYVSAEIFRQYAEHYRKIVTDINEKKNQNRQQYMPQDNQQQGNMENNDSEQNIQNSEQVTEAETTQVAEKKSFTVVEISHTEAESAVETPAANDEPVRKKRVYRRRQTVAE
ncbi:MAG: DUF4167 domain-containing protein [Alphaproteobacteria bacterium]|nr:DUF4167 domain-containing protein [Alphaproteobacteria bacterium]MBQ8677894.1 DUF4167 domain-containing protein [Alphaproteobacteria bacterium]